jgi:hypothetical protein
MGMIHDFQLAPVHAHLNLLGWTSLAVFGLTYRVNPDLSSSAYAGLHFALATIGSIVWLAAVGMFLAVLIRLAVRSLTRHRVKSGSSQPQGTTWQGMQVGTEPPGRPRPLHHDRCSVGSWYTWDASPRAAILIEPDIPKAQGVSVPDP